MARLQAGRFILATNVLESKILTDEQILSEYKAQQSTERGFRFLKDPLFFARACHQLGGLTLVANNA